MKKILIAIDYAPSAQKVAEQGYELGKAINATITLLHVIENVEYYSSTAYDPIMGFGGFINDAFLDTEQLNNIEKNADKFLLKTKTHLKDELINTKVMHGNIADSILETAKINHFDIIVIGAYSKHSVEDFLLGSTAHKIVKHAAVPVFVIPIK